MLAYFRTLIPTVLHLLTHPAISIDHVASHFRSAPLQTLADALVAYLRDARSRGEVKVDDPRATALLFISAIHSLPLFELMDLHGGQDVDHAVEAFVAALWHGLAPTGPAPKKSPPRKKR
jgi:AcrR family transcriptional regulator